jgi:membrane-bound lytic murein transglycosylase A
MAAWGMRSLAILAGVGLLSACGPLIPPGHPLPNRPLPSNQPQTPVPPPAPPPSVTALNVGVTPGPDLLTLGLTDAAAQGALVSFRESCPKLLARKDVSGLTRPTDWQDACAAAAAWPMFNASGFFIAKFESAIVGEGAAYVTGYYEPEIAGVRQRQPGFDIPVYGQPADLVHARPGDAPVKPNGQTPFGRYDETGRFVPYYDRAQIDNGALAGKGLEIGWAADPVEFFFLQIQGSGRLRAPDGSVMRIGYLADNGQNYTAIGILMRQQGLIGTGPGQYSGSMQGIMQYVREHPAEGRALMQQNKSWVFFRELTTDGPLGALGVPVRPHVSLAADPLFTPLGAPVFLSIDKSLAGGDAANGLWVAQDTGGAIKGANRFDSFWGAGADARNIAGGMLARGRALILLPKGTLAKIPARASLGNNPTP